MLLSRDAEKKERKEKEKKKNKTKRETAVRLVSSVIKKTPNLSAAKEESIICSFVLTPRLPPSTLEKSVPTNNSLF